MDIKVTLCVCHCCGYTRLVEGIVDSPIIIDGIPAMACQDCVWDKKVKEAWEAWNAGPEKWEAFRQANWR